MKFYPTLDETLAKRFEPGTEDGISEIRDIVNHGIACGYSGFTYYSDTIAFFNEFKYEIEQRLDDMGLTMSDLVEDSNGINFDGMMNTAVWIVVENWCFETTEKIDALVSV